MRGPSEDIVRPKGVEGGASIRGRRLAADSRCAAEVQQRQSIGDVRGHARPHLAARSELHQRTYLQERLRSYREQGRCLGESRRDTQETRQVQGSKAIHYRKNRNSYQPERELLQRQFLEHR